VSDGPPVLLVGWRGPGDADPNRPAAEALAQIITGVAQSRLNRLVAAPNSDFLQANGELDRSKDASLLFCAAAIRAGADTAAAERALIDSIERLAQEAVAAEDLDRARRQIEARMLFGWQTSRGRAEALGTAQLLDGDYRAAAAHLERVRQLTPDDLRRVAAMFLTGAGRSVVWVTPAGAPGSSRGSGGGGGRP
jgi:zinc protease